MLRLCIIISGTIVSSKYCSFTFAEKKKTPGLTDGYSFCFLDKPFLPMHQDTFLSSVYWSVCGRASWDTCSRHHLQNIHIIPSVIIYYQLHFQGSLHHPWGFLSTVSPHQLHKCYININYMSISLDDLPGTYSITIMTGCRVAAMPMKRTMLTWSYCLRILPSCRNFLFMSSDKVSLHVLMATGREWLFRLPLYTQPKLPWNETTAKVNINYHIKLLNCTT